MFRIQLKFILIKTKKKRHHGDTCSSMVAVLFSVFTDFQNIIYHCYQRYQNSGKKSIHREQQNQNKDKKIADSVLSSP